LLLTYTETKNVVVSDSLESSRVITVLTSPTQEDFTNLEFPHRTFPNGLLVDFFDDQDQKSIVKADYGKRNWKHPNFIWIKTMNGFILMRRSPIPILKMEQLWMVKEWILAKTEIFYTPIKRMV